MNGETKLFTLLGTLMLGLLLGSCIAKAEPYKVAIIDTGFMPVPFDSSMRKLCKTGHYDFAERKPEVGLDTYIHGTYVTYLVNNEAKTENICFLIYKVFGGKSQEIDVVNAMKKAHKAGAKAINMSLSTGLHNHKLDKTTRSLAKKGVKIFLAAGNENNNMNNYCPRYPQCLNHVNENIVIVGAMDAFGARESYSNYGLKVDVYDWGTIGNARGTSFAAPRALGRYIKTLKLDKK